jgi:hypothetical protein
MASFRAAGLITLLAALAAATPHAQNSATPAAGAPATMWHEPSDIATRDLFYGAGGKDRQPAGRLTFVDEDMQESKPKFVVRDERGVEWKVKLGAEVRPEVAATRLLWAAGYFVDENYYRPEITVEGLRTLKRGQQYVKDGGRVERVRIERHEEATKIGTWRWFDNPFVDTPEWHGLRVMMAVLNNWDLESDNNAIRSDGNGGQIYYVSDVGSTFGSGDSLVPSRNSSSQYEQSAFLSHIADDHVDFAIRRCEFFLAAVAPPYFSYCKRLERVGRHVPREEARRIGDLLGRLSPAQVHDAFRAAGYPDDEISQNAETVLKRIAALREL